ncbi:MAG: 30S ribosomal protein S2 [Bdellovibrionales bacterium]
MTMPVVTLKELFEAGVHFGHNTRRWNPKMHQYLFGVRNGVHIIDLEQTVPMMQRALQQLRDTAASGGRVLFVGTKRQAQEKIAEAAKRCGQYYVNHRWLGGMLTNWETVSQSIKKLRELDEKLTTQGAKFTKKEALTMTRHRDKLERALGGIKDMGGVPDIIFVIDTGKESLAIQEAQKLGLPVVAVLDSNANPDGITYPIPGNDDAARAIELYTDMVAQAVLDGIEAEVAAGGKDIGAAVNVPKSETTVVAEETENKE